MQSETREGCGGLKRCMSIEDEIEEEREERMQTTAGRGGKSLKSHVLGGKRVQGGLACDFEQHGMTRRTLGSLMEEKEAEAPLDSLFRDHKLRVLNKTFTTKACALGYIRSRDNLPGFIVYRFQVALGGKSCSEIWTIYRRYSSFLSLIAQLEVSHPRFAQKLAPLPERSASTTFEAARNCALAIGAWLRHVLELWALETEWMTNSLCISTLDGLMVAFLTENWDSCPYGPQDTETDLGDDLEASRPVTMLQTTPIDAIKRVFGIAEPTARKVSEEYSSSTTESSNSNQLDLEGFNFLSVVGKGSFGQVFLAEHRDITTPVAIKVLNMAEMIRRKQSKRIEVERLCMERSNSPFIVNLHMAVATKEHLYFVQDYCSGGEMYFHLDRNGKFTSKLARFYAAECALALDHLHQAGIIYRDLKPENIMICQDGHIKLVDFGLAKTGVFEAVKGARSFVGTMEYLSPEMANKSDHGYAVDYWSLGMVLYEMLVGLPPWYSENREKVLYHIQNSEVVFPSGVVSSSAKDLLRKLLEKNPRERLGSKRGIAELCEHTYFSSLDFNKVCTKAIKPPYKPQLQSVTDVSYFDKSFTNLKPSIERDSKYSPKEDADLVEVGESQGLFDGFRRVTRTDASQNDRRHS